MILSHTPSSLSFQIYAFESMPDDSTWKIHKHLKYNISMYELNLFPFFTPKYVLLASSSSQLMAPPSTQPQQPKSWASPTPGHPRSISGCTLPCTWQKFHNSILSLHVSHHYSENSFRVLPAPFQVPCNMLSCHHHYLPIPPYIIFHSFVILSCLWFPMHSMLFPTSVSLCSVFFFFLFFSSSLYIHFLPSLLDYSCFKTVEMSSPPGRVSWFSHHF